jgi:hypothetical protein
MRRRILAEIRRNPRGAWIVITGLLAFAAAGVDSAAGSKAPTARPWLNWVALGLMAYSGGAMLLFRRPSFTEDPRRNPEKIALLQVALGAAPAIYAVGAVSFGASTWVLWVGVGAAAVCVGLATQYVAAAAPTKPTSRRAPR